MVSTLQDKYTESKLEDRLKYNDLIDYNNALENARMAYKISFFIYELHQLKTTTMDGKYLALKYLLK